MKRSLSTLPHFPASSHASLYENPSLSQHYNTLSFKKCTPQSLSRRTLTYSETSNAMPLSLPISYLGKLDNLCQGIKFLILTFPFQGHNLLIFSKGGTNCQHCLLPVTSHHSLNSAFYTF